MKQKIPYDVFARLLEEKGVKAYDVAKHTGVRQSTLSEWKRGTYTPKADKRKILADYFGVTLEYLDGDSPYPHGDPTIVEKYTQPLEMIRIPVFNNIPGNLPLISITDRREDIMIKNPNDNESYYGIIVNDNSMSPRLMKNDIAVFREQNVCENDHIVIVKPKELDHAIIRRIVRKEHFTVLQSIDSAYNSFVYIDESEFKIIGVVTGMYRSF